MNFLEINV